MSNTERHNRKPQIRTIKIISLVLVTPIILCAGYFVILTLYGIVNRAQFTTLDNQINKIYQNIKAISNNTDDWTYSKACEAELAGDWPTGQFYCSATINLTKSITSIDELNNLQAQYFPIINSASNLLTVTGLQPQSPNDFGINFVISSSGKSYLESKSKVSCKYLIKLSQSINDKYLMSDAYGSKINTGVGTANIILKCTGKTSGDWYAE